MSGLTEYRQSGGDGDFWSWRELLYKFVDRCTPEDVEAITAMAYAEMLEGGFTRVAEFHYLHHDTAGHAFSDPGEMAGRIAAAARDTGIGLTLLPVLYAHSGFGGLEATSGQRRFINTPASYHDILSSAEAHCAGLPDAIVGTAPHSLRAVTPGELEELTAMRPDRPVHIHIAEQEKEVADCLAWSGARPVDWLLDHVAVDERWCLVHATHTTPGELQRIAASGAVVGLCPVTEANLGDGIFNAPEFLAAGGHFGVGSDSNVSICAADELRMLEYSQRLAFRRRNVIAEAATSTGCSRRIRRRPASGRGTRRRAAAPCLRGP
jgi:formiminoglutamate deiminase